MKKQEQFVLVPVPADKVLAVYRFLGTEPPIEPMADPAVIQKAVQQSSGPMRAVLDLLASRPDEWLSVEEIRDELGMDVHELPGVLCGGSKRERSQGSTRFQKLNACTAPTASGMAGATTRSTTCHVRSDYSTTT